VTARCDKKFYDNQFAFYTLRYHDKQFYNPSNQNLCVSCRKQNMDGNGSQPLRVSYL